MINTPKQQFTWLALLKSFGYAWQGIIFVVKTQRNMLIHICAALSVVLCGVFLDINSNDWCWLVVSISLVWCAELFNSAFEFLCDVVMPEYHVSVKRAKDIAAGAVLICACAAAIIGALTFLPYV